MEATELFLVVKSKVLRVFGTLVIAHLPQCIGIWYIGNCALESVHRNLIHWQLRTDETNNSASVIGIR